MNRFILSFKRHYRNMSEDGSFSFFVASWSYWLIAIVLASAYLIYWQKRPNKFPPGPRGIPFFGYLPFMDHLPEHSAYKLSKIYGSILSIRFGSSDMVFLNDFESIQSTLVKQGEKASGRMAFPPLEPVYKDMGIIFLDYGEKFKSQRKFGLMTLRGFGVGRKGMEKICLEELHYLNEELQSQEGKAFDISDPIHHAMSNNICSVAIGRRFEYKDKHFYKMMLVVMDSFSDPMITLSNKLITFAPKLRYVPPFSYFNKKYLQQVLDLFEWFQEIIDEHQSTFDENNIRDFIDAFISEKNKGKDPSFTDEQLTHFIADLFGAGTETTSSFLYWSVLCMLHYPQAQKKLRKEIYEVIDTSGTISMSNKADMPYTNAFIQELHRFRTLAPLGLAHKAVEDIQTNGYIIPKGTCIIPNIWAVHNDPKLWENPEKFCPERFLDDKGKFLNSNYVIPFSVGPRHCLGEQLAKMEIFLLLVGMVQKFEFLPDPEEKDLPNIDEGIRSIGYIPKPYKVLLKEL